MILASSYLIHPLGGLGYQFFSGIGSSISEWLTVLFAVGVYLRRHNCHEHGCLRMSWHPDKDGHPVCKPHHEEHPARGWFRVDRNHPRHARAKRRGRAETSRRLQSEMNKHRLERGETL